MKLTKADSKMFWIHGLKHPLKPRKESQMDWREITKIIFLKKNVSEISPGKSTKEAERGLDIPRSYYWYVHRAPHLYGYMVFCWEPDNISPDIGGGVCPFDTGGLWCGCINTNPPLNTASEKLVFFRRRRRDLRLWYEEFVDYLERNYDKVSGYIKGEKPRSDLREITTANANNTFPDLGWTWEVHVICNCVPKVAKLIKVYCNYETFDFFTKLGSEDKSFIPKEEVEEFTKCFIDLVKPSSSFYSKDQALRVNNILVKFSHRYTL